MAQNSEIIKQDCTILANIGRVHYIVKTINPAKLHGVAAMKSQRCRVACNNKQKKGNLRLRKGRRNDRNWLGRTNDRFTSDSDRVRLHHEDAAF